MLPSLHRSKLALGLCLFAFACGKTEVPDEEAALATSLYALVTTVDGTSFYPPLGPGASGTTGAFDTTLLGSLQVVLETIDAGGQVRAIGSFDDHSQPRLVLLGAHELYFVNVPAAAYFTDPSLAYRFRVVLGGREIGRSDMSSKIFEVMSWVPAVPVGVKLRIERRPIPSLASLSPATLVAGAADFTLTVAGSELARDSIVRFGSQDLATTWVSATELTALVPATLIARTGRTDVTVVTLAPGGGTSAPSVFVAANPTPILTALSPSHALKGSGDLRLTLSGSSFVAGAQVTFAGVTLPATFVSETELTALVPASALTAGGEVSVVVVSPDPGGPSAPMAFDVDNPVPSIASLTPASATAGALGLVVTVAGTAFAPGAHVTFGGAPLATTFVSESVLTALVPAGSLAAGGTYAVIATNAAPGGGASAAATFTVNNPTPTLGSLTPASSIAGSASFTLTVMGGGFLPGAVATLGGAALSTTFVSSTSLSAVVPASLVASAATLGLTVSNPAPSNGPSAAATFTVNNPTPTVSSLTPASASVGASSTAVTLTGTGFVPGSYATFNGAALSTTYVGSTQLVATVPAASLRTAGSYGVAATSPAPGGGTSATAPFVVNNLAPTLTSISPASANVGASSLTVTLTGTNFVSSSYGTFNGVVLTTTFVSPTQLTATVPASSLTSAGTFNVTVMTPAPGGGTSARTFTVNNPAPALTSITPSSASAGAAALTITLSGLGFVSSSYATFAGGALSTTYVGSTQLVATVPASSVATGGTYNVAVVTPTPGGGTSGAATFTVNNPVPSLASISPASTTARTPAFTINLYGSGFLTSTTMTFGGSAIATAYVSSGQLSATVPASAVAVAGTYYVSVSNPGPGGGTTSPIAFVVRPAVPDPAGRTTLYVSTAGNDSSGDGSITNPFRTPSRALDYARNTGWIGNAYIYVYAGTYRLTPVQLSGTVNYAIGLYDGGKPIWVVGENNATVLEYYGSDSTGRDASPLGLTSTGSGVANLQLNFYPNRTANYSNALARFSYGTIYNVYFVNGSATNWSYNYYNGGAGPTYYNCIFNSQGRSTTDYSGTAVYTNCLFDRTPSRGTMSFTLTRTVGGSDFSMATIPGDLRNTGSTGITNPDGSRSHIGTAGGPYGWQ